MNIYLISQTENEGYDTFDSAVVIAEDEYAAKCIHPYSEYYVFIDNELYFKYANGEIKRTSASNWVDSPFKVNVQLIGTASEDETPRVVCASFNAG